MSRRRRTRRPRRSWGRRPWRALAVVAGLASLATAFAVIVAVNVTSGEHKISKLVSAPFGVGDPQFARSMSALFGPPLIPGNHVTPLYNGTQIFEAMLEDIRHAKKSVTFETYIYWSGAVGQRFTQALVDRAHAGPGNAGAVTSVSSAVIVGHRNPHRLLARRRPPTRPASRARRQYGPARPRTQEIACSRAITNR